MLAKNLTPFLFGARATSLRPPKPAMSVVVRASYALGDDGSLTVLGPREARPLSAETYRDDDDDCLGGCVHPSDFADFKTRAEVLVKGACHAPRGEAVTECAVNVKLGDWSKSLRVVGRRTLESAAPAPFVSMPLDWEHAYGGLRFPKNPCGRGFDGGEMPNVLHPRDVLRAGGDLSLEPASFGAVNRRWPQRAEKLGERYDAAYKKTRAPHYAADLDPTYFMEAPADQWLTGHLRGDERLVLQNLHPRVPILAIPLPATRARAFYRDETRAFREIELQLDTLYADLDALRIELSFRGVVEVGEEDLADVRTLVVASEPLAGPKRPIAEYESIAAAYEADPVGLSNLPPKVGPIPPAEEGEPPRIAPLLDAKLMGAQPAEAQEMAPWLDKAIAHAASESPEVKKAIADRAKQASEHEEPPVPRVARPGARPYVGLRRRVRDMIDKATEARARALEKGAPPEKLGALMNVEAIAADPRWPSIDPSYTPPLPLSTEAPGPGATLIDRDLRGLDLRGADLSGANLEGALLTRVRLNGAILKGARLYGATLYGADLSSADLRGADLTRANAAFAVLRDAKLDEAALGEAFFEDADLEAASLTKANGEFAIFTRAKLARASLRGAKLAGSELDDADLSGARLDGADLSRCRFKDSRCPRADFSGADLRKASFEGAVLDEARLFDVRADGAVFASATARRAIFAFSRLRRAYMDRLVASGADFHGADLRDARMRRAALEGAKLTSANLYAADLWKARLEGAKLTRSNLYEAKLALAILSDCDLSGANLKKSSLEEG